MSDPNWNETGSAYGGEGWRVDMVRRYPAPTGEPRRAKVVFVSWKGTTAINAIHTHVRIEPGENPVWDGKEWRRFHDDPERAPDEPSASFVSEARAIRWAVRTMEKNYPATAWLAIWPEDVDPSSVLPDPAEDAAIEPCATCRQPIGEHGNEERVSCEDRANGGLGLVGEAPEPGIECRTLVDGGHVSGSVGDEIMTLHDMHPSNVIHLPTVRALIVERGGALVHLAQVAREYGVTVMLVPDAVERFPRGTWLDIDPSAGTVTEG